MRIRAELSKSGVSEGWWLRVSSSRMATRTDSMLSPPAVVE